MIKKSEFGESASRMSYLEFLETIKVFKMLYGREVAENILTKNIHKWYNLDSESLNNLIYGD